MDQITLSSLRLRTSIDDRK